MRNRASRANLQWSVKDLKSTKVLPLVLAVWGRHMTQEIHVCLHLFFFKFIFNLFAVLGLSYARILVVVCEFEVVCGTWDLILWQGFSNCPPQMEAQSLHHLTTRGKAHVACIKSSWSHIRYSFAQQAFAKHGFATQLGTVSQR